MAKQIRRTTVYFDPGVHRALKVKSKKTSQPISDLVNKAVKEMLSKDTGEMAIIEDRKNELFDNYADIVKNLKLEGRI